MPTRSLDSSVLKWPDRDAVDAAVRRWVVEVAEDRPDLEGAAYLGSYARGDWGPGSDVDLLLILADAGRSEPLPVGEAAGPARTAALPAQAFDATGLPVPADVIVLTRGEWERMRREGRRFARVAEEEGVWVLGLEATDDPTG